ncbi:tyrosine-type recombinase/integrase [Noviherbaspirillum sp.]|uniref:tyrosine-type recombinase/integrase n=1 Tax=Noviherbaspirillum sp. TaxID=1926288 RepID=UPI002FE3ED36
MKLRPIKWTKAILEKLPAHVVGAASSNYEITDPVVAGLKLQVGTTGRKFFWFRYTYRGKKLAIRIGEFGPISIEEARDIANTARAIVDRGGNPQDERDQQKSMPLVHEFAENEYVPHAALNKRTYKNDIAKFRDHILPVIGHLRLSEVTTRDVQMLLNGLKGKLAPATINRVHALLSVFFNLAVSWKRISTSPCDGIKKLKENSKPENFLTPDEVRRILAAAAKDFNQIAGHAISALLLTGLRRSEICLSRHEHLNLGDEKGGGSLYLPHTKSGRSRHVVLNDAALEVFRSVPRIGDSPWIFPGKDPMKPLNNPTKAWHRILKVADVKRCRLHNCRHSFASMLVNEGASLYQVQQLLGHASSVTTSRYAHLASSTLRNTSQLVANLVNETQQ